MVWFNKKLVQMVQQLCNYIFFFCTKIGICRLKLWSKTIITEERNPGRAGGICLRAGTYKIILKKSKRVEADLVKGSQLLTENFPIVIAGFGRFDEFSK